MNAFQLDLFAIIVQANHLILNVVHLQLASGVHNKHSASVSFLFFSFLFFSFLWIFSFLFLKEASTSICNDCAKFSRNDCPTDSCSFCESNGVCQQKNEICSQCQGFFLSFSFSFFFFFFFLFKFPFLFSHRHRRRITMQIKFRMFLVLFFESMPQYYSTFQFNFYVYFHFEIDKSLEGSCSDCSTFNQQTICDKYSGCHWCPINGFCIDSSVDCSLCKSQTQVFHFKNMNSCCFLLFLKNNTVWLFKFTRSL